MKNLVYLQKKMNGFSDALAVGIVLLFVVGAVVFYLYTRIQQTEQKTSLLESILLDLKMAAEVKTYTSLPADMVVAEPLVAETTDKLHEVYVPFEEKEDQAEEEDYAPLTDDSVEDLPVISLHSAEDAPMIEPVPSASDDYESMNVKQLQSLAKSRGISGVASMKKQALIEAIRHSSTEADHDRVATVNWSSSSLIENSVPVVEDA